MSERTEYFAPDDAAFRYVCSCRMELAIQRDASLLLGNGEAHCPGCGATLKRLRKALEAYGEFRKIVGQLAQARVPKESAKPVEGEYAGEVKGELKFRVVIQADK